MKKQKKYHHSITENGNIQTKNKMKKLIIIFMCMVLVFPLISAEQPVTTVYSFHHSVTELGNLQVRQITEYIKGEEVIEKKYGEPMTPVDTNNMSGWDERKGL